MQLTPLDIQQRQFRVRFLRGYEPKDVEAFLNLIADFVSGLLKEKDELARDLSERNRQLSEHRDRERTLKNTLVSAQKAVEQMKANAEKEAKLVVSEAEVKAERILNNAHNRLAQIHEDIAELKRQRIQLEMKLRSTLETYLKMLDMQQEQEAGVDDLESKVKFFTKP